MCLQTKQGDGPARYFAERHIDVTQPAVVERAGEEVRHDTPPRLLA